MTNTKAASKAAGASASKGAGIGHDAMRWIDRWVGDPCCRLLTLWRRAFGDMNAAPAGTLAQPKSVAFIALAEIGALVVAYPAVATARERFPEARQFFVTFPGGRDVLRLCGFSDAQIVLLDPSSGARFVASIWRALRYLRRERVEATVNFEAFARFSTLFAYLTGARWRAGFHPFLDEGRNVGDLVTHKTLYNPHIHAARSYISVVETLAAPVSDDPGPKAPLRAAAIAPPARTPSPMGMTAICAKLAERCQAAILPGARRVILNANASDLVAVRRWPTDQYVELARRLLQDPAVVIVLTGAPSEAASAAALAEAIASDRVANMAGATTFLELLDLYQVCDVMVTNDSGPAHFASLTDLATVALFGPETPAIFGPIGPRQETIYLGLACSPCVSAYNQKRTPCRDNVCVSGISVDMVVDRVKRLLAAPQSEEASFNA